MKQEDKKYPFNLKRLQEVAKPESEEEKAESKARIEALRTEYEKGKADAYAELIDKATEWLEEHIWDYVEGEGTCDCDIIICDLLCGFKQAMEEQ